VRGQRDRPGGHLPAAPVRQGWPTGARLGFDHRQPSLIRPHLIHESAPLAPPRRMSEDMHPR
jgi:hypothetical protein